MKRACANRRAFVSGHRFSDAVIRPTPKSPFRGCASLCTKPRRFLLTLALASLTLPATFAQKVKVEYDKKNDFNRFKTYNWARKNDEYLRPFLAAVVIGATDHNLQAKGLKKVESGGDLVVNPYGSLDTEMSVVGTPDVYYFPPIYGGPWWGQPYFYSPGTSTATILKKGMLVIDLADPHSKQLQWRGIATAHLDATQKEKSLQVIEKAVAKMFKDYPGRPAQ
jgi:Domain of unknown function (DUF4136)